MGGNIVELHSLCHKGTAYHGNHLSKVSLEDCSLVSSHEESGDRMMKRNGMKLNRMKMNGTINGMNSLKEIYKKDKQYMSQIKENNTPKKVEHGGLILVFSRI